MKKGATPVGGVPEADLRLAWRDAIAHLAQSTSAAELRRALPKPYQRPAAEISRRLDELARARSLFAFQEGTTSRYTLRDPRETVGQAALTARRSGRARRRARVPRGGQQAAGPVSLDPPDPAPFLARALKEIQAVQKKLAAPGVTPSFAYASKGSAGTGAARIGGIAVDGEGNVVVTGVFTGSLDVEGEAPASGGDEDVFAAKLDAGGKVLWSRRSGGRGRSGEWGSGWTGRGTWCWRARSQGHWISVASRSRARAARVCSWRSCRREGTTAVPSEVWNEFV